VPPQEANLVELGHITVILQIMVLSSAFRCSYQPQRKVSVATTTHPTTFYLQAYLIGRRENLIVLDVT